jgi:hypothetical protein
MERYSMWWYSRPRPACAQALFEHFDGTIRTQDVRAHDIDQVHRRRRRSIVASSCRCMPHGSSHGSSLHSCFYDARHHPIGQVHCPATVSHLSYRWSEHVASLHVALLHAVMGRNGMNHVRSPASSRNACSGRTGRRRQSIVNGK